MDAKLAGMKASMDLTRTWIVVDMDAFFASVEELDDPSLVQRNYLPQKAMRDTILFQLRCNMPGACF